MAVLAQQHDYCSAGLACLCLSVYTWGALVGPPDRRLALGVNLHVPVPT